MLFRLRLSRSTVFAILGCLALLVIILSGENVLAQRTSTPAKNPTAVIESPDFGRHFKKLGIEGSILIYDSKHNRTYEHNPQRNTRAFYPSSTFKIFNSLVALETGVIPDDISVLTWDGIQRELPVWNHDTNLRQAFKNSTIWFYQVLARKAGHERMQQFIDQVGYGNRQIGTANDIDRFWLEGPLQITPKEQIQFLQRLQRGNLPFSKRTMDLVKDIMVFEQTPDYILRTKTGWVRRFPQTVPVSSLAGREISPEIGWLVGYLEQNNNVYLFATNIDLRTPKDNSARIEVTRRSFKDLGLL